MRPIGRREIGRPLPGLVALVDASAAASGPFAGHFCGGVLIGPDEVATAAHCVVDRNSAEIEALVGADNLCRDRPIDGQRIRVSTIAVHPSYNQDAGRFDLALLKLTTPADDAPRAIVRASDVPNGALVTAVGWGASGGGVASCRARSTTLDAVASDACATTIPSSPRSFEPASMLCARPSAPGADTCSGDSGGPLFVGSADDQAPVVGLVSWGIGCGVGTPGVYARLDQLVP